MIFVALLSCFVCAAAAGTDHDFTADSTALASTDPIIHPPQDVPEGWRMIDEKADVSGRREVMVGLKRSNMHTLNKVLEESSNPGYPGYLHHLSWKEMGDLVRPSNEAIGAVSGMLASNGGTDIHVAAHGDYITASLAMKEIETLTSSSFRTYQDPDGLKVYLLADAVRLPASVAKYVETITGLHGFPVNHKTLKGESNVVSVTPEVVSQTYGIDPSAVTKSGASNIQAIGQFEKEYVSAEDFANFCKQYVNVSSSSCSVDKFIGKNKDKRPGAESMLDVEYIHSLVQPLSNPSSASLGIKTWVYSDPSMWGRRPFCADLLAWASQVLSESEHPHVVSLSYGVQKIGWCDAKIAQRLSDDVQKMGAMGITVLIGSGDDGSGAETMGFGSNKGKLSPSFPASIPYALSVGGTTSIPGSKEQQATRGFGSGGGFSYDFTVPTYQADAVKSYLGKKPLTGYKITPAGVLQQVNCSAPYSNNGRGSPDVALLAENFMIYAQGENQIVSGTSASTPSWAAIISLLNEECLSVSGGKKTLGFINPLFYQHPEVFTDITKGDNAKGLNLGCGWSASEGWDAATGLGTPNFPKLQALVKTVCGSSAKAIVV
jgi:tripeptidyl-peptidase-1